MQWQKFSPNKQDEDKINATENHHKAFDNISFHLLKTTFSHSEFTLESSIKVAKLDCGIGNYVDMKCLLQIDDI